MSFPDQSDLHILPFGKPNSLLALQFGAGNIGRGLVGAVLAQAGCQVIFADVVEELIDQINSRGEYIVHVLDNHSYDIQIKGVSAVNSTGPDVIGKVSDADLVTTAVGLRILQFVAPVLAKGIALRRKKGNEKPLNIIACENGLRATSQLKELVYAQLELDTAVWADTHIGFPDAAVDRIVPPVRCEEPLDVAVEEYFEWYVERRSFVGDVPDIGGMMPVDNILAYIECKLLTLNTGHTTAAYLGKIKGYETIEACVRDSELFTAVRAAMQQSGEGLVRKFGFDHNAHFAYIDKILSRFSNPFLMDECNRVGRDPLRKLAPDDRLILPILNARAFGLPYDKLLPAVGAALHFDNPEDPQSIELLRSIEKEGLKDTIVKYTGIPADDPLVSEIAEAYKKIR